MPGVGGKKKSKSRAAPLEQGVGKKGRQQQFLTKFIFILFRGHMSVLQLCNNKANVVDLSFVFFSPHSFCHSPMKI